VLSYPPGQKGAVEIRNSDVGRLEPGRYLNDNLIEFGLKLWLQDLVRDNPELAAQIHVFNSFFYTKLTEGSSIGFDRVRTWTSRFDLFAKKYIIIPINERLHWYLAIICYPEHTLETESLTNLRRIVHCPRCAVLTLVRTYVLTLDSLGMEHPEAVGLLGQYLQYEALDKHQLPLGKSRRSIGKAAHVPDQPNFFDCGIQLLHLTETFMSDPSYYCHLVMVRARVHAAITLTAVGVDSEGQNHGCGASDPVEGRPSR
ncbi:hypothetical protein C8R47DRAFT_970452, partial [Mycena vitilis]